VPVIMLSARGAELDRVRGLELGADDYVTKPFSLMELLARVASVLRRVHGEPAEPTGLSFGGLTIDLVGQVARRGDVRIELPSRAFAILKVFAKRPGEVVSRDVLLDEAWGYEDYPNTRTVDNHLVKLRRAIEDEPDKPRWLVTVHGAGYKLDIPRDAVQWGTEGRGG
jgi:DNA-binding response OmpR family regulator